jgi:hypothetical protein
MSQQANLAQLNRDGYVIVRGVFSPQEVQHFRELLGRVRDRANGHSDFDADPRYPNLMMLRGDILSHPELQIVDYVVLDPRVISIVKSLLGPEIVYHGDSCAQVGEGPRGFHKDNADRDDPAGIDWQGEYGLIRLGIYLQDHERSSGGLKVRVRSHQYVSHHRGVARNLDTRAGDLVAWYLTTSHSGNAVRMAGAPGLCLHPRLESLVPAALRSPESAERMAFFCTFGRPGAQLERYISYQAARPDVQSHWRRCSYGPAQEQLMSARGLTLRRPSPTRAVQS